MVPRHFFKVNLFTVYTAATTTTIAATATTTAGAATTSTTAAADTTIAATATTTAATATTTAAATTTITMIILTYQRNHNDIQVSLLLIIMAVDAVGRNVCRRENNAQYKHGATRILLHKIMYM